MMGVTVGMIAGGSGLTPMMQVASRILADKDDNTQASANGSHQNLIMFQTCGSTHQENAAADVLQVSLVFANQSEDDIILSDELDKMEREHDNFKVRRRLVRCHYRISMVNNAQPLTS
jgi:cytochrome-b5 reductase